MQEKKAYEFLKIEIYYLRDDLVRTSDGFDDGNTSSGNDGEWDVFD